MRKRSQQPVTPSTLRADIYRILDRVLETGEPVEVRRGNRRLKIVPADAAPVANLEKLQAHPGAIIGDAEDLVDIEWSHEWRP